MMDSQTVVTTTGTHLNNGARIQIYDSQPVKWYQRIFKRKKYYRVLSGGSDTTLNVRKWKWHDPIAIIIYRIQKLFST